MNILIIVTNSIFITFICFFLIFLIISSFSQKESIQNFANNNLLFFKIISTVSFFQALNLMIVSLYSLTKETIKLDLSPKKKGTDDYNFDSYEKLRSLNDTCDIVDKRISTVQADLEKYNVTKTNFLKLKQEQINKQILDLNLFGINTLGQSTQDLLLNQSNFFTKKINELTLTLDLGKIEEQKTLIETNIEKLGSIKLREFIEYEDFLSKIDSYTKLVAKYEFFLSDMQINFSSFYKNLNFNPDTILTKFNIQKANISNFIKFLKEPFNMYILSYLTFFYNSCKKSLIKIDEYFFLTEQFPNTQDKKSIFTLEKFYNGISNFSIKFFYDNLGFRPLTIDGNKINFFTQEGNFKILFNNGANNIEINLLNDEFKSNKYLNFTLLPSGDKNKFKFDSKNGFFSYEKANNSIALRVGKLELKDYIVYGFMNSFAYPFYECVLYVENKNNFQDCFVLIYKHMTKETSSTPLMYDKFLPNNYAYMDCCLITKNRIFQLVNTDSKIGFVSYFVKDCIEQVYTKNSGIKEYYWQVINSSKKATVTDPFLNITKETNLLCPSKAIIGSNIVNANELSPNKPNARLMGSFPWFYLNIQKKDESKASFFNNIKSVNIQDGNLVK